MFHKVDLLLEDVDKAEQDSIMGTNIHKDKYRFIIGYMRLDKVDVWYFNSEDTLVLCIGSSEYTVRYSPDIIDIING